MFERMEVAEQVYEGGTPSKIPNRAESSCDGHVRKQKGGESAQPTNPEKSRSGKYKTNNIGHPIDEPTRAKKTCLLHGPRHSSEECKALKVYSEKYAAQRPHKTTEARSGGKPKRGKTAKFDDNTQEVNTMENYSDTTPRKKKGTKLATKTRKIKSVKSVAVEKGCTYGIDKLNLSDTVHEESDYVLGEENANGHDSE